MSKVFEDSFTTFLQSLTKEEKRWLEQHNAGTLATLRFAQVDYNFLHTVIKFWDPQVHCFRFHGQEISPLPEELGAIVGWPVSLSPCVPFMFDYHRDLHVKFLGLESESLAKLMVGNELNLTAFMDYFGNVDPKRGLHRKRAFLVVLFARFLFVNKNADLGHSLIVAIVDQCEKGKDPMPLCSGELLVSLDRVAQDPSATLTGCPLLLQVWLMERLRLIEPPLSDVFNPKGLFSRRRIHGKGLSWEEWSDWFEKQDFTIRWTVPWWGILNMVDTSSSPHIRIASLSVLTFYFPTRIRRQYGRKQAIPDFDSIKPDDKPMTGGNCRSWEDHWRTRARVDVVPLSTGDTKVSKHFLAWVSATTASERAAARSAERGKLLRAQSSSSSGSVKDRLGTRVVPVWSRLERVPSPFVEENRPRLKSVVVCESRKKAKIEKEKEKLD